MEDFKYRVLDFIDWIVDTFTDLREGAKGFFQKNPNAKRWMIEGLSCLAVGILAGCITFGVLNHEKKTLAVKEENAATPVQEQSAEENIEAGSKVDSADVQDYGDVVIEVVDPGSYVGDIANWSEEEISAAVSERSGYLDKTKYWSAVSAYWDTKGISGNARFCTYLFDTSSKVYTEADFQGIAPEVLHVIKNEMYARHGYSFRDQDLYNYFMGQVWYSPSVLPADFSEKTFSETEVKNLDLINSIDKL